MNIFTHFRDQILKLTDQLIRNGDLPQGLKLDKIAVEPPREAQHGDLATNVAMVLKGQAKQNPRQIAQKYETALQGLDSIEKIQIAGPGFINMTLTPTFWQARLADILEAGTAYGDTTLGNNEKINVEFISANPTGPLHAGHGRNAVLGDAVASVLEKVGYDVCREYYINDAGGQADALARSAYLRYKQALGQDVQKTEFKDGMYAGDYLKPVGTILAKTYGDQWLNQDESTWLAPVRIVAINAMMDLIRDDLAALGITMDVFFSERDLYDDGAVDRALKSLEESDDIYTGVLQPPKGKVIEDWEPRPQTLFRATKYGDDVDRPLKKSDGSWTYFTADIAYHFDKHQRGFKKMINVFGADHGGYIKRLEAATKAVTHGGGQVEFVITQLVHLMDQGQAIKMSKRAGTFIRLQDVVDRVGKDVTRFIMLTRRHDMSLAFDFAKVMEQSKDNPVFYVQYAHARGCSVLRLAQKEWGDSVFDLKFLLKSKLHLLTDPDELQIIKVLASWPHCVEISAMNREPHRIAFYLSEVAALFHAFWNKGKDNVHLRFIDTKNSDQTMARLALVSAVMTVIASGLKVFGITPVKEMR